MAFRFRVGKTVFVDYLPEVPKEQVGDKVPAIVLARITEQNFHCTKLYYKVVDEDDEVSVVEEEAVYESLDDKAVVTETTAETVVEGGEV